MWVLRLPVSEQSGLRRRRNGSMSFSISSTSFLRKRVSPV